MGLSNRRCYQREVSSIRVYAAASGYEKAAVDLKNIGVKSRDLEGAKIRNLNHEEFQEKMRVPYWNKM